MERLYTKDATGIAPDGRWYAGDINALQDAVAAQTDLSQTISLGTLAVGESGLQLVRYGAGEARVTGALRTDGVLRGLGGFTPGAFTSTQRDAIEAGKRPYGMAILNTSTNRWEWNIGTDAAPSWQSLSSDGSGNVSADGYFKTSNAVFGLRYTPPANAGTVVLTQVQGEASPRFGLWASGTLNWGPGSTAYDVSLARAGAAALLLSGDGSGSASPYLSIDGVGGTTSSTIYLRGRNAGTMQANTYVQGLSNGQLRFRSTSGNFDWLDNASNQIMVLTSAQLSISAGRQIATVQDASSAVIVNSLLAADANRAFQIRGNGRIDWGPGGAGALDTSIDRYTSGILRVGSTVQKGGIRGYGSIASDDILEGLVSTDAQLRYRIRADGQMLWGDGTNAPDVNLYRLSSDVLATDDQIRLASNTGSLRALNLLSTGTTWLASRTTADTDNRLDVRADGSIRWGSGSGGVDTALYRSGINTLKTDGGFLVGGDLTVTGQITGGGIVGKEIAYATRVIPLNGISNTTNTTEETAVTVLSTPSANFDGTRVKIEGEFQWQGTGNGAIVTWVLFRDATPLGSFQDGDHSDGGAGGVSSFAFFETPPAGSHTYTVKVFISSDQNVNVLAGSGGTHAYAPNWLRVTKA